MTDAINSQPVSRPQYTSPVQKAPPPPPPPAPAAAPAPEARPDSLSSSKESQGQAAPDQAKGSLSDFARNLGSAVSEKIASGGQALHDANKKLHKKAANAEKNREGIPEKDMKRLEDAAHGGVFKKAAAAAMLGTDIKGLPDAVKQAEQWNQMPQWQRDAAATGLGAAAKTVGFVEGLVHPDKEP